MMMKSETNKNVAVALLVLFLLSIFPVYYVMYYRHRYEFNNDYEKEFEKHGMMCVGRNPESDLVEIVEIPRQIPKVGISCVRV